jgi:lipoate-protein ligase A
MKKTKVRADYKEEGQKLLRISAVISAGRIERIGIAGDFFLHPEEAIFLLEDSLRGARISEISERVQRFFQKGGVFALGITPEGIQKAVELGLSEAKMRKS